MAKSAQAFRTIGEVSEALDTPAHVLRFWESKFAQVRPVKRAGGRRYYRPEDLDLLCGIKLLLHDQGMTIKGVQKLLREKGVRHVAGRGRNESEAPSGERISEAPNGARMAPPRRDVEIEDAVIVEAPPETREAPRPADGPACADLAPLALLYAADMTRLEAQAGRIAPLLERLVALRGRMAAARDGNL